MRLPFTPMALTGAVPVLLFAACLAAYLSNGDVLLGRDQTGNMLLSVNLLKNHSFSIKPDQAPDAFVWILERPGEEPRYASYSEWSRELQDLYDTGLLKPTPRYYLSPTNRTGEYVNTFGIGAAIVGLPAYALLNLFTDITSDHAWWWHGAKLTASVLVAGTVVLIFLTMRRFVSVPAAALGALSFGLGSNAWSVSSQALWQHPGFSFFLALAAWFLVAPPGQARRNAPLYCGAALGAATLCRSTGALFVICVGLYLLVVSYRHLVGHRDDSTRYPRLPPLRTPFLQYALGGLPFAVVFGLYNFYYFDSPFTVAQAIVSARLAVWKVGAAGAWQTDLAEGSTGLLFSPSRGLLVYSPVLFFGVAGAVMAWRNLERFGPLVPLQVAALVVFGFTATWFDWWGGWSYGPRLLIDMGVVLTLSMIPVMADVMSKRLLLVSFVALLLYSGMVQAVGAWSYNLVGWNNLNGENVDLPEHRHRLWSLRDSQIRYYVEHFGQARHLKRAAVARRLTRRVPILIPTRDPRTP